MLDHYTTGLQHNLIGVPDDKVLKPKPLLISIFRFLTTGKDRFVAHSMIFRVTSYEANIVPKYHRVMC
jgi:hypothetical protein